MLSDFSLIAECSADSRKNHRFQVKHEWNHSDTDTIFVLFCSAGAISTD